LATNGLLASNFILLLFFHLTTGNYGNKLDENSPAMSSTTPPSNPIYDGNQYYYLPWVDQKPCVQVGMTESRLVAIGHNRTGLC
jgi:hypothetical protein